MIGNDVAGARVVVAGVGVTGRAVARMLGEMSAVVVAIDSADGEAQQLAASSLAAEGIEVRLAATRDDVAGADLVVASPGWRLDQPLLVAARDNGVEVIGEPELAWRLRDPTVPWLGVTGTNGKTTTVGMLEAILLAAGLGTVAAGNVGLPLIEAVDITSYDVLAVEVSSQQLAWSPSLRFHAGALLNVAPDHLDWHDSMDAYVAAKTQIWTGAIAIAVVDDPTVAALAPPDAIRVSVVDPRADYTVVDGRLTAGGVAVMNVDELQVGGPHNLSNALVAIALARTVDVPLEAAAEALRGFAPGRHRNETVAEVAGVRYVDDSKATNAHAAAASIEAYRSVVWIAGGLLKGADVDELVADNAHKFRGVVLLGRDRDVVADALARHAPDVPVSVVATTDTGAMSEVVRRAAEMARPGDTVLLAPAAASWDMFRDYAERGDLFAAAARALSRWASGGTTA